jgi:carbon-monoxide dehydrogenase medium subunit
MLYQKYEVAHTIMEAVSLLSGHNGANVRLVAGGTDLILQLHERILSAEVLVDISRVPEMRGIHIENGQVVIGASTTYSEIIRSPIVQQHALLLIEASKKIGAVQIQNMATLGGNIGNASPAADAIPCLYVLGAEVVLRSLSGERRIPIEKFHQGYRKIDLQRGELIKEIRFSIPPAGSGSAFYKYALRKSQAISVVDAAACVQVQDGQIKQAAVALGAVASTIIRSPAAEAVLIGQPPSEVLFARASEAARQDAHPIDDIRGSASFRRYLVAVCVSHAVKSACERAG